MRQFNYNNQRKGQPTMKRMRVMIYEENIEYWGFGPC
jgi:hypothetical protein